MKLWLAVLIAAGGCAALKLAGFVVPARLSGIRCRESGFWRPSRSPCSAR